MNEQVTAPLSLVKGQKVDLTKGNPGLKEIGFGLAWDLQEGQTFDLDAFAIPVNASGKQDGKIVYFGHLADLGIIHSGDNLTGAGDGDDEVITVEVAKLSPTVEKVVIGINIFSSNGRNFGQVKNASCRAFNKENPTETIVKYDISEDYSTFTGILMGELYKKDGEWKFNALGTGVNGDLNQLAAAYN